MPQVIRPVIAIGDEFPNSSFNYSYGYFELIRLWNACNEDPDFNLSIEIRRGNPSALKIWEHWTWANNLFNKETLDHQLAKIKARLNQISERVSVSTNQHGELIAQVNSEIFSKVKDQALLHIFGLGKSPFEFPLKPELEEVEEGNLIFHLRHPDLGHIGKILISDNDKYARLFRANADDEKLIKIREVFFSSLNFRPLQLPVKEIKFWEWFEENCPQVEETRKQESIGFHIVQHGMLPWLTTTLQIHPDRGGIRIEGWHNSYNGGKWWEYIEERAINWFIILADEDDYQEKEKMLAPIQRWQKTNEYLSVPADWEVLAAASPEYLRGSTNDLVEIQSIENSPGRIIFQIREVQLGILGQIEIRKQSIVLSRITFSKPADEAFAWTEEHRLARDAHFQRIIEEYFSRLQQDGHTLTSEYPAKTRDSEKGNKVRRGAPVLEERVDVEWKREKASKYLELISKGKSGKIAAELVGFPKKTLDRWVQRLLDNNSPKG